MDDRSNLSLMDSLRAKLANRRSHSTPPIAESQGRLSYYPAPALVEHRPGPNPDLRLASSHTPQATPPFFTPSQNPADPYIRYDPRAYQAVNTQSRTKTPVSAPPLSIPKNSTPLLQLPRPRAMWRRSLEDLSPDSPQARRAVSWHEGDARAQRVTVDLASALPPEFLDLPPDYASIEQTSKSRQPQDRSLDGSGSVGYANRGIPRIVMPEAPEKQAMSKATYPASSMNRSPPQPLTVDTLLQHPMLR